MTVPGRGPSLPQARDNTNEDSLDTTSGAIHDHYNLHAPQSFEVPIANQDHNAPHARSLLQRHNHNTNTNSNSKSNSKKRRSTDPNARLPYRRRQDSSAVTVSDDGVVTAIVQTVNIVQVIDSAGATVSIHTQYSDSNTVLLDASTGSTVLDPSVQYSANVEVSSASASQAETTAEGTISATTSAVESSSTETSGAATAISILAESSEASHVVAESTSSFPITTTEAPFPVFSGASNSSITLGAVTRNSTAQITLLAINSTSSLTTSSSTDSSSNSSSTSSSSSTSKESESTTQTTTLDSTSTADIAAGAGFGNSGATAAVGDGDGDTNSAVSTSSSGTVDTKTVVGGVFGGIAAVALLLVITLLLLRRRKRNGGSGKGLNFLGGVGPKDNRLTGTRGLLEPGPSPPTSQTDSQTNRMTQRSSLPFFISSSLAALSGSKRDSTAASGAPEQGFVRLSGKKLPSVLTHGGDGFSDPRESVFSGTGSSYRDSSGFYGGPGGLSAPNQRLALGSPMRPESGIIVMRSGPGKTPVREENPFTDPEPNPFTDSGHGLSPPRPPLGRSLTGSASGHSRGSGSRFTEEM